MGIRKTLKNLLGFKSDLASLTVVGVGPGDSSLLTIAAVEAIKKAKLIVSSLFFKLSRFSISCFDKHINLVVLAFMKSSISLRVIF